MLGLTLLHIWIAALFFANFQGSVLRSAAFFILFFFFFFYRLFLSGWKRTDLFVKGGTANGVDHKYRLR